MVRVHRPEHHKGSELGRSSGGGIARHRSIWNGAATQEVDRTNHRLRV